MVRLYDYQLIAIEKIQAAFKSGNKRVLLQSPTGSGKTIIFTHIASLVTKKHKKVVIISHRLELLAQAGGTMEKFNIKPQLITSKEKTIKNEMVTIAMNGTLRNRLNLIECKKWWNNISLIIIDECHRCEYVWIKDFEKGKYKLGVSATPLRSGNMPQLKTEYDHFIPGLQIKELIKINKLLPDYYFGVPIDLKGVKKDKFGEFQKNHLFDRFNNKRCYSGIVENWIKYANGLCTIVFCVNIQHCIETCKVLNEAGIGAKFITSPLSKPNEPPKTKQENPALWTRYNRKLNEYNTYKKFYPIYSGNRDKIIKSWKNEEFPVIINAGIAIEGFDHPPIMCVIVYLATTSQNKWLQMVGRGSRVLPEKKEFILLDFGNNAERLGHYQSNREFSLQHKEKNSNGNIPYKNCKKCESLIFISSKICSFCGYEYQNKKKNEFVELVAEKTKGKNARTIDISKMSFKEIEIFAKIKGYKSQWIWRSIYFTYGMNALKEYGKYKGYSTAWLKFILKKYNYV